MPITRHGELPVPLSIRPHPKLAQKGRDMEAGTAILDRLGIDSVAQMAVNECYTIEVAGFEDLTIEKVGRTKLSVAHHYVQRGDLMCNPEIVFRIEDGVWTPIRFTQHPHIHRYDPDGLAIDAFVQQWGDNLRNQGFVTAASELTATAGD